MEKLKQQNNICRFKNHTSQVFLLPPPRTIRNLKIGNQLTDIARIEKWILVHRWVAYVSVCECAHMN